jgi:hypothetical protein
MPRFAEKLANTIAGASLASWPEHVRLVSPGAAITLVDTTFFSLPDVPARSERRERQAV